MGNRDEMYGFGILGGILIGSSVWMLIARVSPVYAFMVFGLGVVMVVWTYFRNR